MWGHRFDLWLGNLRFYKPHGVAEKKKKAEVENRKGELKNKQINEKVG